MKNAQAISLRPANTVAPYLIMMKPKLTLLSVLTALAGAYLASQGSLKYILIVHTFIGTALIGGCAGVLNHFIERQYDALMKRTEHRPIPSGLVQPAEALYFGIILGIAGLSYLALFTNWIAVSLSVLTLAIYLAIYTPLKRKSPFATVVGGIPGAMPPLIGWSIVRGSISLEASSLFFILFFWQIPHFLSLAWMYRHDYARSGFNLLSVIDPTFTATGRQILVYSIALLPASLMPTMVGIAGMQYFFGALACSTGFLLIALHLFTVRTNIAARNLFLASPFFLVALFLLMML